MYPSKIKAKAKAFFEAGISIRDIAEKLEIKDFKTVFDWSQKGEWIKGQNVTKLEQIEQESVEAVFAKQGLNKTKAAKKILEHIDAMRVIWVKDKPGESEDDKKYTIEVPDYMVQQKAVSQLMAALRIGEKGEAERKSPKAVIFEDPNGNVVKKVSWEYE